MVHVSFSGSGAAPRNSLFPFNILNFLMVSSIASNIFTSSGHLKSKRVSLNPFLIVGHHKYSCLNLRAPIILILALIWHSGMVQKSPGSSSVSNSNIFTSSGTSLWGPSMAFKVLTSLNLTTLEMELSSRWGGVFLECVWVRSAEGHSTLVGIASKFPKFKKGNLFSQLFSGSDCRSLPVCPPMLWNGQNICKWVQDILTDSKLNLCLQKYSTIF